MPREMPLGKIHLRNLKEAADCGCAIVPPMLTFYNGAETVREQPFLTFDSSDANAVFFDTFQTAFSACEREDFGYEFQARAALSSLLLFILQTQRSRLQPDVRHLRNTSEADARVDRPAHGRADHGKTHR